MMSPALAVRIKALLVIAILLLDQNTRYLLIKSEWIWPGGKCGKSTWALLRYKQDSSSKHPDAHDKYELSHVHYKVKGCHCNQHQPIHRKTRTFMTTLCTIDSSQEGRPWYRGMDIIVRMINSDHCGDRKAEGIIYPETKSDRRLQCE